MCFIPLSIHLPMGCVLKDNILHNVYNYWKRKCSHGFRPGLPSIDNRRRNDWCGASIIYICIVFKEEKPKYFKKIKNQIIIEKKGDALAQTSEQYNIITTTTTIIIIRWYHVYRVCSSKGIVIAVDLLTPFFHLVSDEDCPTRILRIILNNIKNGMQQTRK